jgi:hypothetical protein
VDIRSSDPNIYPFDLKIYKAENIVYHKLDKKYLPEAEEIASDWDENDAYSLTYVRNRTHWIEKAPNGQVFYQKVDKNSFEQ